MKILIVDDNAAIREIIRDILAGEGHTVRTASTVSEAVEKMSAFLPEILFLDSRVGGEDGLHVLAQMDSSVTPQAMRVVLLKGSGDIVPTDNPFIRVSIDKPFKSSDVVDAVKRIQSEKLEVAEERGTKKRKEKKERKHHLFRRDKRERIQPSSDSPDSRGVSFGSSYVIFEEYPDAIYRFMGLFDPDWYDVMIVTTGRAKAIKERFTYSNMEVLSLSGNGKGGSLGIQEIGTLTSKIRGFIDSHARPVVVFDTFGELMEADGLNQSLLMLHQLMSDRSKMCTFGVSVDPGGLTGKDRNIFLHSMIEYKETQR